MMPSTPLQVVVPVAAACSAAIALYYCAALTPKGPHTLPSPFPYRLRLRLWAFFQHLADSLLPDDLKLRALSNSHRASSTLYAVAKLDVFEAFRDGPQTAEQAAQSSSQSLHCESLFRVLRYLASLGLFTHDEKSDRFSLTGTGSLLLKGPGSQLARVLANNDPQDAGRIGHDHLEDSLREGGCAFQHASRQTCWEFYDKQPHLSQRFEDMMEIVSHEEDAQIATSYPGWARATSVVDVAGGPGLLLSAVVQKHPHLRGHATVFERPSMVDSLDLADIEKQGIQFVSGDFFEKIFPPNADIYVLRQILHDWDDKDCIRILINIGAAMNLGSRLLVIDSVISGHKDPLFPFKTDCDIDMMVWTGGRERSIADFTRIFSEAGFKLNRIIELQSLKSIVEAVLVHEGPAWHKTINQGVRLSRLNTMESQ